VVEAVEAAAVEALAQNWATQIGHEAQSWASASLTARAKRDATQAWAVTMVSAEWARQAVSWADHWSRQPWGAPVATVAAAVCSRWHAARGVLGWESYERRLQAVSAPGWDCQSLRATQPGRQCLVELAVSTDVVGSSR
jgi:hypothetical protein